MNFHLLISNLLIISLISPKLFSYEIFPEYGGFRSDLLNTTPNSNFGAEYGADIISFDQEANKFIRNQDSKNYLSTSVGSLSGSEFHVQKSIVLKEKISEKHEIQYIQNKQENYHQNVDFQLLKWNYQSSTKWSYGILGEFFHAKANDDIGLFLTYESENAKHNLLHMWPDYSLNNRNSKTDRYINGFFPRLISYSYTKDNKESYLKLVLKVEPYTKRSFPDNSNAFEYRNSLIQFVYGKKEEKHFSYIYRLQMLDTKIVEKDLGNFELSRLLKRIYRLSGEHKLSSISNSEKIYYIGWDLLSVHHESKTKDSHLLYFTPWLSYKNSNSAWSHKLTLSSFNALKDKDFLSMKRTYEKHIRYDAQYKIPTKNSFDWIFGLSLDVDRFGTEETWEGGFSKLHWRF